MLKTVIKNLANSRGHKILNSTYEHNKSFLTVYCPRHDTTYCTNVHNYKRSIFGVVQNRNKVFLFHRGYQRRYLLFVLSIGGAETRG